MLLTKQKPTKKCKGIVKINQMRPSMKGLLVTTKDFHYPPPNTKL